MSLLVYPLSACLVMAAPQNAKSEIIHFSFGPLDQWFQCVRNITGKPFVFAFGGWNFLPCPDSLEQMNSELKGKAKLVPGERWDFLLGKTFASPGDIPAEFWQDADVRVTSRPWDVQIPGSRHPTEQELDQLRVAALQVIRPFLPVVQPIAPETKAGTVPSSSHTAKFLLELFFDIHQLSPGGPESIVGIFRQAELVPDGRLIYGEYRDGKPVFLWDSPLFPTRFLSLAYRDVDGDGKQEMLLRSERACRTSCNNLVIFTIGGIELTRQALPESGFLCIEGHSCPIEGGEFHFVEQGRRTPDRIEVEWLGEDLPTDVYAMDSCRIFSKQALHGAVPGHP